MARARSTRAKKKPPTQAPVPPTKKHAPTSNAERARTLSTDRNGIRFGTNNEHADGRKKGLNGGVTVNEDGATFDASYNGFGVSATKNQDGFGGGVETPYGGVDVFVHNKDQTTTVDHPADASGVREPRNPTTTVTHDKSNGYEVEFSGQDPRGRMGAGGGVQNVQTKRERATATGATKEDRANRAQSLLAAKREGEVLPRLANGEEVAGQDTKRSGANVFGQYKGVGIGAAYNTQVSQGIQVKKDQNGAMTASFDTSKISSVEGSLTFLGFGAEVTSNDAEGRSVDFAFDPKKLTPKTRAALEKSFKTGVLPGAQNIQTKAAQRANKLFTTAERKHADATKRVNELKQLIKDPANRQRKIGLTNDLQLALRTQQIQGRVMQGTRNTLNQEWGRTHQAGDEVLPGVTVNRHEQRSGSGGALKAKTPVSTHTIIGSQEKRTQTSSIVNGKMVKRDQREVAHNGWLHDTGKDTASVDSDNNLTLSATREVSNGNLDPNRSLFRDLGGDATTQTNLADPNKRKTSRGTRTDPARTYKDVTGTQNLTSDQLKQLGQIQNQEDGTQERFKHTAGLVKRNMEFDLPNPALPQITGGNLLNEAVTKAGMDLAPVPNMSPKQVADIYGKITGPEDLKAFTKQYPDQASALQANFVKAAAVIPGAVQNPKHVLGMLSTINDPKIRAQTAAQLFHTYNKRDDQNATAMLKEIRRLSKTDPELAKAISAQSNVQFSTPKPPPPRRPRTRG